MDYVHGVQKGLVDYEHIHIMNFHANIDTNSANIGIFIAIVNARET